MMLYSFFFQVRYCKERFVGGSNCHLLHDHLRATFIALINGVHVRNHILAFFLVQQLEFLVGYGFKLFAIKIKIIGLMYKVAIFVHP